MNQVLSRLEEAFVSSYVYHALNDSDRLIQHRLGVSDVIGDRQRAPLKVSLQEQVRLDMRRLQVMLWNLDWHKVSQGLVQDVLVMSYRQTRELLRVS